MPGYAVKAMPGYAVKAEVHACISPNWLTYLSLLVCLQGELEEGLKNFQLLVDENPRDFRPYLCQVSDYGISCCCTSKSDTFLF